MKSTVPELIIENAPNLRTLIFGEIPNLYCENAPCGRSENELIGRTYSYENPPDFELSACMQ